jgi:hypothetical protein
MKLLKKYLPFVLASLFIALDLLAVPCITANSCFLANYIWPVFYNLIRPLYIFSEVFVLVALILIFVRNTAFNSWLRFAIWFIPLSIIVIGTTPTSSNSWMPLYFIGKDTVTLVMAGLFTVISLVVIVWKQFDLGKKLT